MPHMHAAISCRVRHYCLFAFIFASLSIQPAHALIIGEIEVISVAGEPLLAYVPITPDSPYERITTACFSLIKSGISPKQERANLSAARLELEGNRKTGRRIKISTRAPVNSHSLKLQLKAKCIANGLIIREFRIELKSAESRLQQPIAGSSVPATTIDAGAANTTGSTSALQKPELNGSVRVGYFSSSRKLDEKKDLAIETIIKTNQTGNSGDGKIFVIEAVDSVRVRTGEKGDLTLD